MKKIHSVVTVDILFLKCDKIKCESINCSCYEINSKHINIICNP